MGEKIERLKRIAKAVGQNLAKIGQQGGKILNNLEKADKEMDEKMKNIMGGVK